LIAFFFAIVLLQKVSATAQTKRVSPSARLEY
jgi:hypothetical protein